MAALQQHTSLAPSPQLTPRPTAGASFHLITFVMLSNLHRLSGRSRPQLERPQLHDWSDHNHLQAYHCIVEVMTDQIGSVITGKGSQRGSHICYSSIRATASYCRLCAYGHGISIDTMQQIDTMQCDAMYGYELGFSCGL